MTQMACSLSTVSRDRHEVAHGAEGLAPEVGGRCRRAITRTPASRQGGGHGDNLGSRNWASSTATSSVSGQHQAEDFGSGIHRRGFQLTTVMARDAVQPTVPGVEVGLEYLNAAARDDRTTHRRISSSLFPLNITPETTSINPDAIRDTSGASVPGVRRKMAGDADGVKRSR